MKRLLPLALGLALVTSGPVRAAEGPPPTAAPEASADVAASPESVADPSPGSSDVPPDPQVVADDVASSSTGADPKQVGPGLFIMQPTATNVLKGTLESIVNSVAAAAEAEGLQVMTFGEAQSILQKQAELMALGGDAPGHAVAEVGRAVGARHVLALTVTASDADTTIQTRLIDTENAKILARRELVTTDYDGDLLETARVATRLIVAPIFGHLKGQVKVAVSEEGANLLIDGDLIGVTPVSIFDIPGGHHTLTVTKDGFIRHQETVSIKGNDLITRDVRLRPSVEFLADYRGLHGPLRIFAWVASGLAVAAGGTAGTMGGLWASQNATTTGLSGEFNNLPVAQRADPNVILDYETRQAQSRTDANLYGGLTVVFGAVAGAALVGAISLWVFGEDPDRYVEFE